ncbi:hypothetical protein [Leekyejoonella antrihumi]|uniref:Uncharacterized protein n=1 Tax=Leekyejoonella antrihumi TaxID=1660198 RepID=A0A563DZM8_9MICO|nr:hypothetical protein [Leekyejoonella antrihumi]TWP35686.1 hypothetical protein FGL98_12795 [Leekyejoonella antrihumi]
MIGSAAPWVAARWTYGVPVDGRTPALSPRPAPSSAYEIRLAGWRAASAAISIGWDFGWIAGATTTAGG